MFLLLFFTATMTESIAQQKTGSKKNQPAPSKPKLIVGLVIDQMRWDYLYRYKELYGRGGFNRLMNEGFSCENTMITHLPTYTAVGHTGIYTGSFPSIHGIVGNNWYDKKSGKNVYCTDDSSVSSVGSNSSAGKMSPKNMLAGTITDELRLSSNFKSKVIGISLKDRGAILPAGHSANAAYWYDESVGSWISSTYYMNALPTWVNDYNVKERPDVYFTSPWNTLLPIEQYTMSSKDHVTYEGSIPGEKSDSFPHRLDLIKDEKYKALRYTPFGNTYTLNFAKASIVNEKLGKNDATDFLAVSLSSPDYIGHVFGPNSVEAQDNYLRLDRELSDFINYLDAQIGKGNYLIFLSADHGVSHVPGFLREHRIPAGSINPRDLVKELNDSVEARYGIKKAILKIDNSQLYIDENISGSFSDIKEFIAGLLNKKDYVLHAFDLSETSETNIPSDIKKRVENSYLPKRSGDIQIIMAPNYFEGEKTGTTHGLWNPYDAHIPLLWYGWGIVPGKSHREVHMADIAPTLAALLSIQMPSGCLGKVIEEVIK